MRWPRGSDDRGETLIEVVTSLVIMSVAVVALVGGLATAIRMSDVHRKQAKAAAFARAFAEYLENQVAASPSQYAECIASPYAAYNTYSTGDAVYHSKPDAVKYWNGTNAFVGTCTVDNGVQRITLKVWTDDPRGVVEYLDVVIRKPCRWDVEYPGEPTCT
jgi:Tfp pilus assembly protein PilV